MSLSKTAACMIGLGIITLFGVLSFIWPDNAVHIGPVLTALTTLTGSYFVIQVANNGVKGRFWNQQMHEAEHPEQCRHGTE